MSRKVSPYVLLPLCAAIILNAECTSGAGDRCLKPIGLDVDEIESHLSELNLTDVPTVKMMTAGFKCPITALPFGALKSDWARLLLLREAQPDGSIIRLKLVRLMRILIIAYYQMEERVDVTSLSEARAAKKSLIGETTTIASVAIESQPHRPSNNNSLGASSNNANRHCSCTDSLPSEVMRLGKPKNDCPRIKTNTSNATAKFPSSNGTIAIVSSDVTYRNVTSSNVITDYYPGNARKAALRILGNCLKHPLKNVARQSSGKVYEIMKSKAKYAEKGNEIDDREGDRTVIGISPPTNEFWRYVTFPTRAPLIGAGASKTAYRMRGLNGPRPDPRKSRKRMRLNSDIYESLRQFYGVGQG